MIDQYKQFHIPKSTPYNRRPAITMSPTTMTIHNTGNPISTAQNERNWLANPSNKRQASYHIVIDEHGALECLPLNEVAWHAGDGNGPGNRASIGIEICESGNYAKTLERAVELVANLLKERGWGVEKLRRHYDWSGKNCPRLMNMDGKWGGWLEFKASVAARLLPVVDPVSDQVNIIVNGKILEHKGTLKKGVTSVSVRAVAEAFGAQVTWNGKTRAVTIKRATN
ncbi:N-acetylmuramoyl-L-alanine amidase [Paenibacillus sp. L3-i20]|uniref:N-acetylmuramoyl-L-alanine amidase n=1 Tax=Paenibacillus sp. L3-i20 TaxID=2905833 RepID=UPI001EDDD9F7|nr:N-acetylmuramoyl-L-alanine amidase [Paenibacillus sp. L3-i20]GKU78576.1 hypothetical protein L3i20_v229730 [Paenibacillus sp. L3-i20]